MHTILPDEWTIIRSKTFIRDYSKKIDMFVIWVSTKKIIAQYKPTISPIPMIVETSTQKIFPGDVELVLVVSVSSSGIHMIH